MISTPVERTSPVCWSEFNATINYKTYQPQNPVIAGSEMLTPQSSKRAKIDSNTLISAAIVRRYPKRRTVTGALEVLYPNLLLSLHKQMHDKRRVAESLCAYVNSARLDERWA